MNIRLLLVALALTGCGVKELQTQSVPAYSVSTFKKESKGCAKKDTTSCASYEVVYPVFAGLTDSVAAKIQKAIDANVSMGNPEAEGWSMSQVADDFIKNFESFEKESPELAGNWYYKAKVNVETLVDTLISLSVADEFFTGGAHGGGGKYFISVDPRTGRAVELDDVFKPGFRDELRLEGERVFRASHHLLDTASLMANGFEFPENKFQLNDNYGFTADGISFVYNAYEIASYAEGPTEIVIPYEKMRGWLKTNP